MRISKSLRESRRMNWKFSKTTIYRQKTTFLRKRQSRRGWEFEHFTGLYSVILKGYLLSLNSSKFDGGWILKLIMDDFVIFMFELHYLSELCVQKFLHFINTSVFDHNQHDHIKSKLQQTTWEPQDHQILRNSLETKYLMSHTLP